MKRQLKFTYNWNNKLDCVCFTTLRLSGNWEEGMEVDVWLKGKDGWIAKGPAVILDKKTFHLNSINEFIARLDTGYSAEQCKTIVRKMYKKENPLMDLLLLKYVGKGPK